MASDSVMVPHVAKFVEGGLYSGQKGHLKVEQINFIFVVKDLLVIHDCEGVAKGLSDMNLDISPDVLDATVLSRLPLVFNADCVNVCNEVKILHDMHIKNTHHRVTGNTRQHQSESEHQTHTDMADPRVRVEGSSAL